MQHQWYIARDGKQYGPVSESDLAHLVQNRELLDGDYLWRQGFENWLPAGQVAEVRALANKGAVAGQPKPHPNSQMPHPNSQMNDPRMGGAPFNPADNNGGFQPDDRQAEMEHARAEQARAEQARAEQARAEQARAEQMRAEQARNEQARQEQERFELERQEQARAEAYQQEQRARMEQDQLAGPDHDEHAAYGGHSDNNYDVQDLVEDEDSRDYHGPERDALGGPRAAAGLPDGRMSVESRISNFGADVPSVFNSRTATDRGQDTNNMSAGRNAGFNGQQPENEGGRDFKLSWPLGVGIGIAALFILLVGATFALPFIVPPETIKSQISSAIKKQTGRDVSFKGKMSYRFFPSFGLDLNNIIIHNPETITGPDFLSLGRLQADLAILPLLSKRVEIEKIIMHRPEITLINDGKGNNNYQFKNAALNDFGHHVKVRFAQYLKNIISNQDGAQAQNSQTAGVRVAQAETIDTSDIIAKTLEKLEREEAARNEAEGKPAEKSPEKTEEPNASAEKPAADAPEKPAAVAKGPADIQFGEIEIVNGAVKIIDQKQNSETEIGAINLSLQAPAADKAVTANGTLRFLEDRIALNAKLSTLGTLLEGEIVDTEIAMNSDRFEGKFDGKIRVADAVEYEGTTDVQTYSLQGLLAWLGVDVPKQGYGGAYVRGKLLGNDKSITLQNATFKVDNTTLIGSVRLLPLGTRPKVEALLRTDMMDLTPYTSQQNQIKRSDINELFGKRKTAVLAWSSSKIDVSFLNKFDATLQIGATRLKVQKHQIQDAKLGVKINAGLMTAQMNDFKVYGGTGSLNVSVNGSKASPSLKSKIDLSKINIKPLLENTNGIAWLSGVGNVSFDLTSAGGNQQEMVSALNGTGNIALADGAIEGVNIPGMIRNLQVGKLSQPSGTPSEKTDFSELTASFTIDRGIVQNKDLNMKGPLLRLTGEGVLNLPAEQIDYGLQPKLVGDLAGQGGQVGLSGINIPIRVKGPMANPKFIPDTDGLLKNNGEAINNTVKTVEKVVKDLKKKKISSEEMKSLLNGMIEGNKKEGGNLLDNILQ